MKETLKNKKGISLIALVVTLVVLLILSAISINFIVGDNGIFKTAKEAKEKTKIAQIQEALELAKLSVYLKNEGEFNLDDYLDQIVQDGIINKEDIVENDDGSYEITTDDGYIFEIKPIPDSENPSDVEIGYVGTEDGPRIRNIKVTNRTTNSISVEVETVNAEDATYKYEYRKDGEDDNSWKLAEESKSATCTITGLAGNQIYDIRVTVTTSEGNASKTTSATTGELEVGTIEFEEYVWQGDGTSSIIIRNNSTDPSYHLEYRIGVDGIWTEIASGQEITGLIHGQTVYGRLYDGVNEASPANVEILDKTIPEEATIQLGATTANTGVNISATITHKDNQSGVDIAKCKWVYNTQEAAIGIEEADLSKYTGTFSSNGAKINLNANNAGTYYLHVLTVDKAGNAKESISDAITITLPKIVSDGSFSSEKGVNTPKLVEGMTPVVWDASADNGSGGQGAWVEAESVDEWYNYKTTAVNGTQAKQWANAMTEDGSLWVWIPRYAYQIASNYHTNSTTGGTINIEFLKGTTNTGATGKTIVEYNSSTTSNYTAFPNGYVVHPGFEYSSTAPGLWVAKFEASQSDAGNNAADYANSTGGTSGVIKIQPGVNSWRNITIGEAYTKCLSYAGTTLGRGSLNSHLMKNAEWGAVAYLSRSEYGKNGEIWINPNSNYITGQAGTGPSVASTADTYAYTDETYGVQASTTGNIYGIYDMSGGSVEHIAAYINNSYIQDTGSNPYGYGEALITGASHTKDVYAVGTTDSYSNNYTANQGRYGDAVYETSNAGIGSTSWHQDVSVFPHTARPFFPRGGYYDSATSTGAFYFHYNSGGAASSYSFRPVLVIL